MRTIGYARPRGFWVVLAEKGHSKSMNATQEVSNHQNTGSIGLDYQSIGNETNVCLLLADGYCFFTASEL